MFGVGHIGIPGLPPQSPTPVARILSSGCAFFTAVYVFSADPFAVHFEQELQEEEVEELKKMLAGPLEYQHSVVSFELQGLQ